jgi:hypothetical protein
LSHGAEQREDIGMRLPVIVMALVLATPALAQSGDPAAGSANAPANTLRTNPSGSGTSTSGGKDDNGDQGRDKMGTTGRAASQGNQGASQGTSREPAQSNVTGRQKAGTNAEGTGK